MKTLLISTAAIALMAASVTTGFACPYNSAKMASKMTIAEAPVDTSDEAMSTFDPNKLKIDEEEEKSE